MAGSKKFDRGKATRELARERVGTVKPSQVIRDKKSRLERARRRVQDWEKE